MADAQQPSAPSVIRIKRKRDEEPLDSLLLDRSKRRAKHQNYVFRRAEREALPGVPLKQEYDESGIPIIRATPVGEEKRDPYATGRYITKSIPKKAGKASASTKPRRFHLSRSTMGAGVRSKGDIATFVERRLQEQSENSDSAATEESKSTGNNVVGERKFKRPATKQWKTPKETLVTALPDAALMQQLDNWSLEASQQDTEDKSTSGKLPASQSPKVEAMEVDDADYVYDTYYRHLLPDDEVVEYGISIGHLVIGEDEEELWEAYLDEDEASDQGFDTDDQDSNAEDYYGADYPEDEVDEDDEYDQDAYQYRRQADDLEEFDVHEHFHEYDAEVDGTHRSDDGDHEARLESNLGDALAWRRNFGPGRAVDDVKMDD